MYVMMDDREWYSGWIWLLLLTQIAVTLVECFPVVAKDGDVEIVQQDVGLFTEDNNDSTFIVPAGLLVTIATFFSLIIVLALCACGEKPKKNNQTEDCFDNEGIDTTNNVEPLSPTPDELAVPASDRSPTNPQNGDAKSRSASLHSHKSISTPQDEALIRSSTIDRRLPELPPTPMPPVSPTNEDEEDDYNRTYDVIGETKGANNVGIKGDAKLPEQDDVFEVEDEQYACVTDNAVSKQRHASQPDPAEVREQINNVGNGPDVNVEEGDDAYAMVVVGDATETENASYASVSNKDDKNGYARLRSLHKQPFTNTSSASSEKSGYARLRDVTLEGAAVGGAVRGDVGGPNDNAAAPPVPYKPPDLQNEDEAEPLSTIERSSSTGAAGAAAPVSIMPNNEGNVIAPNKKREPPYTQVSARESLDVVRARQQAEQSACISTHYQSIEEDQNLDADHDGIYEPVDDQHIDKQPVMTPPPLPSDRQGPSNEPSASNDWQVTRAPRVYEEITDETRPKPPNTTQASPDQATDNDDDIQPYAVAEKRPTAGNPPTFNNQSNANYATVNKVKGSGQSNNNARTEVRSPDIAPPVNDDGLPLYAVVDKKGKGQGSKVTPKDSAQPDVATPQDLQEDSYQSIEEMPTNSDPNMAAIAGGMVHVSESSTSSKLWHKKEHMYIDVESKEPSVPPQTTHNAPGASHSYEIVNVVPPATSKKEKQKSFKKAKKEAKKEKKNPKGGHHKGSGSKGETSNEAGISKTVWRPQDAEESNDNGNNNTTDEYEDIVFPLQETRI